ncbi:MAG TPA: winged helix-turn-helix domain-containing protein [Solirubrobacterales bacterium]
MPRTAKATKERSIEEAISYALGHRIRIEILAALNERSYSSIELARIVRQPLSTVSHHIEELLKSDSIEIARTERVRNIEQNFYRAMESTYFSDEEMAALPYRARQELNAVVLRAAMAEAMASFWAGKISNDYRAFMAWKWFNVDAQGREDIADEMARSWARLQEIEAESTARRASSGEEAQSIVVTSLGFPRSRTSPNPPAQPEP